MQLVWPCRGDHHMSLLSPKAMRVYMRRRRASLRREGLCPTCGHLRLNLAWVLCGRCRRLNYERVQRFHVHHQVAVSHVPPLDQRRDVQGL